MAYTVMPYIVTACRFVMCLGVWLDYMWFTLTKLSLSAVVCFETDDGKLRLRAQPDIICARHI